ncbi:pseudouridine-5'-phosphate glycosidase [Coprothermobacteraceae bacterium]|nr:pseudouridine-5'-phosphate glycosidase [Coprothermobacteraceae bacterium]
MIQLSPPVEEALRYGEPVVALESTIITHGMPYPTNVETALEVEEVVRRLGAVPATIGVIKGRVVVGLDKAQIEFLGNSTEIVKLGMRDLPMAVVRGLSGGTTVSATMYAARTAGIRVFATGGIGGVHREAARTFDISMDLEALASIPVTVVCAGAKAILDLPATLEYLETKGVLVLGYQTEEFPAFYSSRSGLGLEYRVDTPQEVAQVIRARDKLGLSAAVLVANPPPSDRELPADLVEELINKGLEEAKASGVRGKAVTPFLLDYLSRHSGGETLETNVALIKNNASVAAQIALALSSP